ncbi:MAG: hypothetical protein L3J07_00250 [Candidatus Magasanikbacteria bacterium]|nr:hypothetical protein [Candidatus Magasanikbacteria bacterium]
MVTQESMGKPISQKEAKKDMLDQEAEILTNKSIDIKEYNDIIEKAFENIPSFEQLKIEILEKLKNAGIQLEENHPLVEHAVFRLSEIKKSRALENIRDTIDLDVYMDISDGIYQSGSTNAHSYFNYIGGGDLTFTTSALQINPNTGKLRANEIREQTSKERKELSSEINRVLKQK